MRDQPKLAQLSLYASAIIQTQWANCSALTQIVTSILVSGSNPSFSFVRDGLAGLLPCPTYPGAYTIVALSHQR